MRMSTPRPHGTSESDGLRRSARWTLPGFRGKTATAFIGRSDGLREADAARRESDLHRTRRDAAARRAVEDIDEDALEVDVGRVGAVARPGEVQGLRLPRHGDVASVTADVVGHSRSPSIDDRLDAASQPGFQPRRAAAAERAATAVSWTGVGTPQARP